jgi:hypothetical protein
MDAADMRVQSGQWTETGLYFVLLDTGCQVPGHMGIWTGSVSLGELMAHAEQHSGHHGPTGR